MGPRKIIARLAELHPHIEWPAPSTAGDILYRANLVQPRERRTPPHIRYACAPRPLNRTI
jgi:hypothetical protein